MVNDEDFRFLITAMSYNQINAVVISTIGLLMLGSDKVSNVSILTWSCGLFIIGTLLFNFSIYLSVLIDFPRNPNVIPVGGITMMFSWLMLLPTGVLVRKKLS